MTPQAREDATAMHYRAAQPVAKPVKPEIVELPSDEPANDNSQKTTKRTSILVGRRKRRARMAARRG